MIFENRPSAHEIILIKLLRNINCCKNSKHRYKSWYYTIPILNWYRPLSMKQLEFSGGKAHDDACDWRLGQSRHKLKDHFRRTFTHSMCFAIDLRGFLVSRINDFCPLLVASITLSYNCEIGPRSLIKMPLSDSSQIKASTWVKYHTRCISRRRFYHNNFS